ncbi:D-glycero-beta-D-manno-heptose 1-phosphate adenylyltransferase [Parafrankia sp. FMc6]|uniref:D-glycero-beta-D-manno-heptose 1-phosphate adenylyltransferase n=1 Tax=Parafrankia soli TaxID=2599596 RepID=UPI0034D4C30F
MQQSSDHIAGLIKALPTMDDVQLRRWGRAIAAILPSGGRLLAAGNGGAAAHAQHLVAELVGRFQADRMPLSALALTVDTSTLTAIGNDFGFEEIFARQVQAHGRAGDILITMSTSGRSPNLLRAVAVARDLGITTWALTGPAPNPIAEASHEYVDVVSESAAHVQECHLVAVHMLCATVDGVLGKPEIGEKTTPAAVAVAVKDQSVGPMRRSSSDRQVDLVVLGDVLLDTDITGEVKRVSPEAPVPVVSSLKDDVRPGGAGLAALLAAKDGHRVTLITALGSDSAADLVTEMLTDAGVSIVNLGTSSPTAVKTRVRAGQQTLLMLDHANPPGSLGRLPVDGRKAIRSAGAVLVCDYGRGVAAAEDVRQAVSELAGRTPVVWDPHPLGPPPVAGILLATPNSREADHFASGISPAGTKGDIERARRLRKTWRVGQVAVTQGRDGVVLVNDDTAPPLVIPAPIVFGGDARGAGDCFAATTAVLLGAGVLPSTAVTRAVAVAADYVVGGMDLGATSAGPPTAHGVGDARSLAARVRAGGGTVVATGGCFDLLHRGHVALLQHARQLGDCLIVCLNSDASVTRLKGKGRPLVSEEDRAGVLQALSCVDAVVLFDQDTPADLLGQLRPHLFVKGGDYAIGDIVERAVVEQAGGQVVLAPYLDGRSTTSLIEQAVRRRDDSERAV